MNKIKQTNFIEEALKTLLEICIQEKFNDRDEAIIKIHENNEKIKKTLHLLEE